MRSVAGARLLLVEDELLVLLDLEDRLGEIGCRIAGKASNFSAAMGLATSLDIDAALIDLDLAGQPSYPVADVLRKRGIPFLFSTGFHGEAVSDRYADCPLLIKPFETRDLEMALARLLECHA